MLIIMIPYTLLGSLMVKKMKSKTAIKISTSLVPPILILGIVVYSFQAAGSDLCPISVGYASVVHEGNLTIAGNEVFLVDGGDFHQNGSVLVRDNATLIIRNARYYQTAEDYEHIAVRDQARFVIENSSALFSYAPDVKISVLNQTVMNVTNSVVTNSLGGVWIWMGQDALLNMRSSNMSSLGDGGRVVTDHSCRAEIQNSTLDFAVCWDRSIVNVSGSAIRKGAKAWSTAQVLISDCIVDYLWAYQNCRMEIKNTTVPSDAPFEVALRSSGDANVYIFSSVLEDNVNVATQVKVRLRDSSTRNVSAYDNSVVWLVNTTAESVYTEGQAMVYNFSTLQDAINKANETDRVLIPPGIYRGNLVINKTLSLVGEDKETTFVFGDGTSTVVLITADDVHFSEFAVLNGECGISVSSVSNCTITRNVVANVTDAINLTEAEGSTVTFNTVRSNDRGICLCASDSSTIAWNTFADSSLAVQLAFSTSNIFHHNNFVNNANQFYADDSANNAFDDGLEGNYWSDFVGTDTNHDGIGDSEHVLNDSINDTFPLLGLSCTFDTMAYTTSIISNSTISSFEYFEYNSTVRLRVSNSTADQSYGFCRVAIPYGLINGNNISVVIDGGTTMVLNFNSSLKENSTHRWTYFAYEHSTHEVVIVPEISLKPALAALTAICVGFLIVKLEKRKQARHFHSSRL